MCKVGSQKSHLKGSFFSWTNAKCFYKWSLWAKLASRNSQLKDFFFSWTDAKYFFNWSFWAKLASQKSHSNDFPLHELTPYRFSSLHVSIERTIPKLQNQQINQTPPTTPEKPMNPPMIGGRTERICRHGSVIELFLIRLHLVRRQIKP